jgi:hypothetical protein
MSCQAMPDFLRLVIKSFDPEQRIHARRPASMFFAQEKVRPVLLAGLLAQ